MSKPVKEMIIRDYQNRFGDLDGAVVIDIRGIDANKNNDLRVGLQKKDIRITVVKNTLARTAFKGSALETLTPSLDGPSALAYGSDAVVNVARELVDWAKKLKTLDLKGAVLDGEFFEGADGVKRLSEFPTKDEAQATVVQLILTPGSKAVGAALAPGRNILGIVKQIQEKLEAGETIAKAG